MIVLSFITLDCMYILLGNFSEGLLAGLIYCFNRLFVNQLVFFKKTNAFFKVEINFQIHTTTTQTIHTQHTTQDTTQLNVGLSYCVLIFNLYAHTSLRTVI